MNKDSYPYAVEFLLMKPLFIDTPRKEVDTAKKKMTYNKLAVA